MKGSALIAAFIVILIGAVIIGGMLMFVSQENRISSMHRNSVKALYIAEAGLERVLGALSYLLSVSPGTLPVPASVSVASTSFEGGTYSVAVSLSGSVYTVTSTGVFNGRERVLQQNIKVINIWDVAVFSGTGSSGTMNGCAHIRGTVYALGEETYIDTNGNNLYDDGTDILIDDNSNGSRDHLGSGDIAIDSSGTFYIGNNYEAFGGSSQIPATFFSRIPSIVVDGLETLQAELNIKYGKMQFGGSSQVGKAETVSGVKEFMDSVNVVDGFNPSDPTGLVYTDVLLQDRTMFSEKLRFPHLNDVYGGYTTASGGRMAYLQNNGLEVTSGIDIPSNITPDIGTDFSVSDGTNSFSKIEDEITINGIIYINGDIAFDKFKGDRTFYYGGKGSITSTGSISINTDFITDNDNSSYLDGKSAYPEHNVLGFMTPNDINIGESGGASQLEIMAIMYAGGDVDVDKQSSIVGAVLTKNIDLSSQVPEIYQVKKIRDNLPPGMIAIDPVLAVYSWQEVYD